MFNIFYGLSCRSVTLAYGLLHYRQNDNNNIDVRNRTKGADAMFGTGLIIIGLMLMLYGTVDAPSLFIDSGADESGS